MAVIEHESPAVEVIQPVLPQPVLPDPGLTISDYLLLAAEEIEKHGWCTGHEVDGNGRHCALGALHEVGSSREAKRFLADFVGGDIIEWNDREVPIRRIFRPAGGAYVAETFREAAEAARE